MVIVILYLFHDTSRYYIENSPWFLYDNGLRHERVNQLSTTRNRGNFQLFGPHLLKLGLEIFSTKMPFFGTEPSYSNNPSLGSCLEDAKYA